jgi:peptide/nickel transport system substrate-binding protein
VVLRIGVPQPPGARTQDAVFAVVASLLQHAALVTTTPDGSIQQGLASHWQPSSDGRRWRFTLRADLTFEDGSPLDAAAAAASLNMARRDPRAMTGLRDVVDVRAESPVDLVIELRQHSALLLDALSMYSIGRAPSEEITAGPYRAAKTAPASGDADTPQDRRLTLEAFDGYYLGRPRIDRIELRAYGSPRGGWVALLRGDIDFLYDVPAEASPFVEASRDIEAFSFLRSYVHLLGFNVTRGPLRDVRVRRAIALAVDREAVIAQAFGGHGVAVHGAISPRHWAYDASIVTSPRDTGAARRLIAEALPAVAAAARGASAGRARRPVLQLSCLLPEGYPAFERSALVLQRQLLDIGVDLRPEVLTAQRLVQRLGKGEFETYLFELGTLNLNHVYGFWHSRSETVQRVDSGYSAADDALDRLRRAGGQPELRAAIHEFQRVLAADPPAVFLASGETSRAVRRLFDIPHEPGHDVFALLPEWRLKGEPRETQP